MFSPFLRKPFKQAVEAGVIPPNLITIAGTWGTVTDQGDLTYLNLVHLGGLDGTDADDLTRGRDRGPPAGDRTRSRRSGASCPAARTRKLRNFGMTLGHPRHPQDRRALQPDRARRARAGPLRRLDRDLPRVHRRLRRPDPADHRPLLPGALPVAGAEGRRQPDRRRPQHRRRQDLARGGPQHDVLRGPRPGRRAWPPRSRCGPASLSRLSTSGRSRRSSSVSMSGSREAVSPVTGSIGPVGRR